MLRILLEGEISIINKKEYLKAINEHLSYLIRAAKSIR